VFICYFVISILQKWKEESPFRDEKVGASHKRFGLMGLHRGGTRIIAFSVSMNGDAIPVIDTYQVAFFLKKNQTHSLLVKVCKGGLIPFRLRMV